VKVSHQSPTHLHLHQLSSSLIQSRNRFPRSRAQLSACGSSGLSGNKRVWSTWPGGFIESVNVTLNPAYLENNLWQLSVSHSELQMMDFWMCNSDAAHCWYLWAKSDKSAHDMTEYWHLNCLRFKGFSSHSSHSAIHPLCRQLIWFYRIRCSEADVSPDQQNLSTVRSISETEILSRLINMKQIWHAGVSHYLSITFMSNSWQVEGESGCPEMMDEAQTFPSFNPQTWLRLTLLSSRQRELLTVCWKSDVVRLLLDTFQTVIKVIYTTFEQTKTL